MYLLILHDMFSNYFLRSMMITNTPTMIVCLECAVTRFDTHTYVRVIYILFLYVTEIRNRELPFILFHITSPHNVAFGKFGMRQMLLFLCVSNTNTQLTFRFPQYSLMHTKLGYTLTEL